VDIRTLPFLRFDDNESHCQRRHAFDLGGGAPFGPPNIGDAGPDEKHPFVVRNMRAWNVHWAIHPVAQSLLLDGIDIKNADYGIWRPVYRNHVYRGVTMTDVPAKTHYAFVEKGTENQPPPDAGVPFPAPLATRGRPPACNVITEISITAQGVVVRRQRRGQRRHRPRDGQRRCRHGPIAQLRRMGGAVPHASTEIHCDVYRQSGQCGAQSARCGWGLVAGRGYESPGTRACAPGP